MDNELLNKIDNIVNDLDNSSEVKELTKLKNKLLDDKELLKDLEKLKTLDKNTEEYSKLKIKLYDNKDYKRYKELENKLYYFSLEAGSKLSTLTEKKHENN